jgi:esterase/lipase superfamily enzyme
MPTTIFFASNRILTGPGAELGSYGPNIQPPSDSTAITYGTAFVYGIDVGENIQGTVTSIQDTKAGSFARGVSDDLSQAGRNLLVFIHGFDNNFSDALTLAAFNREWLAGSGVQALDTTVVAFSWPSLGQIVGFPLLDADYRHDQTMAQSSGVHMMTFMANLEPILRGARANRCRTFLLAHSMGNLALESAVQNWFLHGNGNARMFDHAVLAAGDCGSNTFGLPNMTGLSALPNLADRVSIYYSGADDVLKFSGDTNFPRRLGESGPPNRNDQEAFPPSRFRMVDASGYRDYDFNPITSHQYYRSSPTARADIAAALQA